MSTKTEKTLELYRNGYNCAQAVVCAFAEECNITNDDLFRMSEGFGSGIAVGEMCGALSGMTMVIGLKNSIGNPANGEPTKADTYQKVKTYIELFKEKHGSYLCRDLKGIKTGTPLCSCEQCIIDTVALIEKYLKENQKD